MKPHIEALLNSDNPKAQAVGVLMRNGFHELLDRSAKEFNADGQHQAYILHALISLTAMRVVEAAKREARNEAAVTALSCFAEELKFSLDLVEGM